MAGRKIHFEIFCKKSAHGGWHLVDALEDRSIALTKAQELIDSGDAIGVNVVKESFDEESGDYATLKIFEAGETQEVRTRIMSHKEAQLPCFQPQDLYSHHARATIARLLNDYLVRERLTAIEFLHRADAVEKLSATGTILQHAIQKAAVSHAGQTGENVQSAVKQLNELVSKATERLYKDERAGVFPRMDKGGLADLYAKFGDRGDADYLISASIAKHLAKASGWGGKLEQVLLLMESLPTEEAAREACLTIIDRFVSEMLAGRAAIQDLMGEQENLGASLEALANLFLGRVNPDDKAIAKGARLLSLEFQKDKLPNAREAIGQRILAELKSPRRLEPGAFEDEVCRVRRLATKMVMGQGKYLNTEDIMEAFVKRSKRLVASDAVDCFLEGLANPAERLEKLLFLEENIVGEQNKRHLAALLEPILKSHGTEKYFIELEGNPIETLRLLASLQKRVLKSSFQQHNKTSIAAGFDLLASVVEERAEVLKKVQMRTASSLDRAVTLLRLSVSGTFTEGRLGSRAKHMILKTVQDPEFVRGLAGAAAKGEAATARVQELKKLMAQADLSTASAA